MDTTVGAIAKAVIAALKESRYGELSIKQYRMLFSQMGKMAGDGPYTPEVGKAFAGATSGPRGTTYCEDTLRARRRVARLADEYLLSGKVDLGRLRGQNPPPMPSSPGLLDALRLYAEDNEARGLAESTRSYYERLAREFALHVESKGLGSFDAATPGMALEFVADMRSGRWSGTSAHHFASNFRPFLKHLGRGDMAQALTMARQPRERHALPVIPDDEEDAVARACADGTVGPRDAAITLLALTTGMRSCDIVGLELGDVDWRTSTIATAQRKTGSALTVPMVPAVAEAMARYVLEERPKSPFRNVFLSTRAPFGPLGGHSGVYRITRSVFAAADVEGGGTLLMRHNAASKMARAGSELPVVAAVLGHADPDSCGAYMESDGARMLECVLPLPKAVAR